MGDVVGTGSSRKSATNSILWHMGDDIPFIPNKRGGGVCIGNKIAPIFFNTMEDSGALPIECDVDGLKMNDVIDIYPHAGKITAHGKPDQVKTNVRMHKDVYVHQSFCLCMHCVRERGLQKLRVGLGSRP